MRCCSSDSVSYLGMVSILFLSFVLAGCPKKIPPIEGAAGITPERRSEKTTDLTEELAEAVRPPAGVQEEMVQREILSEEHEVEEVPPSSEGFSFFEEEASSLHTERVPPPPVLLPEVEGGTVDVGGDESSGPLQDVFFDFDQWMIRANAKETLEQNARWLGAHSEARIQIEGHCDIRGTEEYNLALGDRRAKAARKFLIDLGISPSRISFISYGEEKNFCHERSEACYQKNRRSHFVILE
ncbi:MAG: peptidoglycan-associated lipoprotein Pal [Nitrospiria bacterium]